MKFLEPFWIAIATYSAIPAPIFEWNEKNMRYSICCFPAVGLFVGAALWLWYWVSSVFGVGSILFAAAATVIPLLITGGIHMDGFMDTTDALSSHRDRERKLEILKDSHCGAFAVLYCGVYLLLTFGLFTEVYINGNVHVLLLGYILSRSLSALTVLTMKNARGSGMLMAFQEPIQGVRARNAVILLLTAVAVLEIVLFFLRGAIVVACAFLTLFWYRRKTLREFGGITGDTCGYFLQICELMILLGAWIGSLI